MQLKKLFKELIKNGISFLSRKFWMTTGSQKPRDILWDFSEELIQGNDPKVSDYQNYFKNQKKQINLMEDLIACKIAFLIAHPELNKKEDPESLNNLINMLKSFHKRRTYKPNKN